MKELSIEEKAKAYDEAIKYAQYLINERCKEDTNGSFHRADLNKMFPKLAESEDERVRNKLIEFFKGYSPDEEWWKNITQEDILAWLEKHSEQKTVDEIAKEVCKDKTSAIAFLKSTGIMNEKGELAEQYRQDEHNPADKVEPKFKVGDWIITNKNHIWYVDETPETTSYMYRLINQYGKIEVSEFEIIDKKARLWTIQDAKDGDVLTTDTWTFIFKKYQDKFVGYHCAASTFNNFSISDTGEIDSNYVHPATKEQRDLLFQKMKEAGYEWNDEKKELKKIEKKCYNWSEEDEYMINFISERLFSLGATPLCSEIKWLKSLKDRYAWKPSEL